MSIRIRVADKAFINYDDRWSLVTLREKEDGSFKEKEFTFTSLYDILVGINRFVSPEEPELVKASAKTYKKAILAINEEYKQKLEAFKEDEMSTGKFQFSVASVTGGPDHFSTSLKNHNQISTTITRSSDSHLSKNGYSTTEMFPGNHSQAARIMFEVEVGEVMKAEKKDGLQDFIDTMEFVGDKVLEGFQDSKDVI